jgi:membrane protease YdiL (CAAX protease family)
MFADPRDELAPAGSGSLGSVNRYVGAVVLSVVAILSQYFVPELLPAARPAYVSFVGGLLIVYGIPIVLFLALVGARPLDRAFRRLGASLPPAIGWYGALSLLGLLVALVLVLLYEALDPGALDLLSRPNPALENAASNPWFWVAFSFVIGAVEETIFRGWIFGYWVARGSPNLGWHAVWTSALFAGVHLYYGLTYAEASPIAYSQLFLLGLAFALAVRASRGNLVWVALLHGANDASAFLTVLNPIDSLALHYGIVLVGGVVALLLYLRSRRPATSWMPPWTPGPPGLPPPPPTLPPMAVTVRAPPPPGPPPPPP